MEKIIKITDEYILVANDAKDITKIPVSAFDFEPTINKKIEVYQLDGDFLVNEVEEVIVTTPAKKTAVDDFESLKDKININIVNENKPQNYNSNYSSNTQNMGHGYDEFRRGGVSKWMFIIVSLFLGGFGGNFFMLGKTFAGIICLLFCWTYIPALIAVVQSIMALFKRPDAYGKIYF